MTFYRCAIMAGLTACLVKAGSAGESGFFLLLAACLWAISTDPTPLLVERALEALRNKYQR